MARTANPAPIIGSTNWGASAQQLWGEHEGIFGTTPPDAATRSQIRTNLDVPSRGDAPRTVATESVRFAADDGSGTAGNWETMSTYGGQTISDWGAGSFTRDGSGHISAAGNNVAYIAAPNTSGRYEATVKLSGAPAYLRIMARYNPASGGTSGGVDLSATRTVHWNFDVAGTAQVYTMIPGAFVPDNAEVRVQADGEEVSLYINGEFIARRKMTGLTGSSVGLRTLNNPGATLLDYVEYASLSETVVKTPDASQPPAPALSAGFRNLAFYDDFDSPATIDMADSKAAGFKWYIENPPWNPQNDPLPKITVSNSTLTIVPNIVNGTYSICSYCPSQQRGNSFKFGYFEARMRWGQPPTTRPDPSSVPAFWMLAKPRVDDYGGSASPYAEIDIIEASEEGSRYNGTLHQWTNNAGTWSSIMNAGHDRPDVPDFFNRWHRIGLLWKPNLVVWYLDDVEMNRQAYGSGMAPVPNAESRPSGTWAVTDTYNQVIILGTAQYWPIDVDYVRVWQ